MTKYEFTTMKWATTQVSYRFLALGCFPANLVSDEKEQKTEDRDGQFVY